MKKVLAMMLTLTMLSSTGAMCFADQGMDISFSNVSTSEVDVSNVLEQDDDKTVQKQELMDNLSTIQNDNSLTFQDKVVKFWDSIKAFVKKHYVKIGVVTGVIALAVVALVFGPQRARDIKEFFVGAENKKKIDNAMESFEPIYNKINGIVQMKERDMVVNVQLSEDDEQKIEKFQQAFGIYAGRRFGVEDADVVINGLSAYATDELLGIIRSEENNKIVDEFLEVMKV